MLSKLTEALGSEHETPVSPGHFTFLSDVELRHDKMVGLFEMMLKLHRDLPTGKKPHGLVRREERIP